MIRFYAGDEAHMTDEPCPCGRTYPRFPEGIYGFLDALDFSRCEEVRLADCWGDVEVHLKPGEGNIDFAAMFARIEGMGFEGHYTNAFGSLDDMLNGRDYLVDQARRVGVG